MAHEVQERIRLPVFLTHEDQRHIRRQQQQRRAEPKLLGGDNGGQTITGRAIADLIVVLSRDDEFLARESLRSSTMLAAAVRRKRDVFNECLANSWCVMHCYAADSEQ